MEKFPVIIDHKETQLSIQNQALIIRTPEQKRQSLPLYVIDTLIIYGNPQISANLFRQLAEHNITVALLPARGKGSPAWTGASLSTSAQWRLHQYNCYQDPECRHHIATTLLQQKLKAQNHTLSYLQAPTLQASSPPNTLSQLLGYEGHLAKQYFQTLSQYLDPIWQFKGRNRRPPQDPYNALISLGYTLITTEINNAVQASGLDPWLGFYHETYPARPALSLDLIEPLRPQIDLWSLMLLEQYFTPEDFTYSPSEGCRLNKSARKIYYQQWAEIRQQWQDTYPPKTLTQTCLQAVQQLKDILQERAYHPKNSPYKEEAPF